MVVWTVVTAAAAAAGAAVPGACRSAAGASGADDVADLLVAVCTTALALALVRLWLITSVTVLDLLAGRTRSGGGATRRLVLVACGAAVLAGTTLPAHAAGGEGPGQLAGLALPDRAVAPPRLHHPAPHPAPRPAPQAPTTRTPAVPASAGTTTPLRGEETYVVRAGDSLWSIAEVHRRSTTPVERRWREIWQANRAVVGDDPDLILPGQALRLPGHDSSPHQPSPHQPSTHQPHSDGDR